METQTIEQGCPLCKGNVKGSDQALYYCEHCNILFSRASLESSIQTAEKKE